MELLRSDVAYEEDNQGSRLISQIFYKTVSVWGKEEEYLEMFLAILGIGIVKEWRLWFSWVNSYLILLLSPATFIQHPCPSPIFKLCKPEKQLVITTAPPFRGDFIIHQHSAGKKRNIVRQLEELEEKWWDPEAAQCNVMQLFRKHLLLPFSSIFSWLMLQLGLGRLPPNCCRRSTHGRRGRGGPGWLLQHVLGLQLVRRP